MPEINKITEILELVDKLKNNNPILSKMIILYLYKILSMELNLFNYAYKVLERHYNWIIRESDYEGQYGSDRMELMMHMGETKTQYIKYITENNEGNVG